MDDYYAKIAYPPVEGVCEVCNGNEHVRQGELTPGRPGFGMYRKCPRWNADTKRCDAEPRVDHMGLEVSA